jgi:muramoyltetrapeptide carboxypeptidase
MVGAEQKTIGVMAPASPIDPIVFEKGLDWLRTQGFAVHVSGEPAGEWQTGRYAFSSASPEQRVQYLYELLEDSNICAIFSTRGGYGAMEMLPLLDYERIARNPKPFVGISDVTVLLTALYQFTGVPAIHGAVFPSGFARANESSEALASCKALFELLWDPKPRIWGDLEIVREGARTEARIMGGNLCMLSAVHGTPWAPSFDDHILFIEEIGEKSHRLHRMLYQLKLSGAFERLAGVVVGQLVDCDLSRNSPITARDVIIDIFREGDYPILMNAPFGHGERNLPFRLGERAQIDGNRLVISS